MQYSKSEEWYRCLFEQASDLIVIHDMDGAIVNANDSLFSRLGYTREEILGMNWAQLIEPEELKTTPLRLKELKEGKRIFSERRCVCKDGSIVEIEANVKKMSDDLVLGVCRDVTRQRAVERELREAETKFRTFSNEIIDSLPGIFVLHDQNGRYLRWNKQFEQETGYTRDEIRDLNLNNFFDGAKKEAVEKGFRELLAHPGGEVLRESAIVIKGGGKKSFFFKGKPILYEGRQCFISTGIDISDRIRAEEELKKSEANLHTILDNTDTVYVLLDKDLTILSYNQRALDFAASELGHHKMISDKFLDYFPASRGVAITKWMNKVIAGEPVEYETSYPKPGPSFTCYGVKMFPVFNKDQQVLGIVTAVQDITHKKLLELEILNQKVQEQKKITRAVIKAQEKERTKIGQELHDNVNQILASARIYLTASCESNRDNKNMLAQESIMLIDSAIQELRLLARNEITPQCKQDLRQLIQPLVDDLNEHAVIQTKFDYCLAAPAVDTDLKLNIYRIVQEQITNILKHSFASSVHIRLNGDEKYICLSVADDGKGFETANNRKGIGITNIMNRIESFNGEFSLQSSPGNGCKLSVKFPR